MIIYHSLPLQNDIWLTKVLADLHNNKKCELKFLLSYWYHKNVDLEQVLSQSFDKPYPRIIADSGAYTAMTKGVEIDIHEYGNWIRANNYLFDWYSNLDVIMNADKTLINQRIMEGDNLTPVPVFHIKEEFSYLKHYADNYPLVALGIAGLQKKSAMMIKWLDRCHDIAKSTHGFAMTSWQVLKRYNWKSVDSSSYGSAFRFGELQLFNCNRFIKMNKKSFAHHEELINEYGYTLDDLQDKSYLCGISLLSYARAESWLTQHHKQDNKIVKQLYFEV